MKPRKRPLGTANMVGARIEQLRKAKGISQKDFVAQLQLAGIDINPTSYSKLEGQIRIATDKEIYTIAQLLQLPYVDDLFHNHERI